MLKLSEDKPLPELIEQFITSAEQSKRLNSLNSLVLLLYKEKLTLLQLTESLETYLTSKEGVYRARAILLYYELLDRVKSLELTENELKYLMNFFVLKTKDIHCVLEAGKSFNILLERYSSSTNISDEYQQFVITKWLEIFDGEFFHTPSYT